MVGICKVQKWWTIFATKLRKSRCTDSFMMSSQMKTFAVYPLLPVKDIIGLTLAALIWPMGKILRCVRSSISSITQFDATFFHKYHLKLCNLVPILLIELHPCNRLSWRLMIRY